MPMHIYICIYIYIYIYNDQEKKNLWMNKLRTLT